jgi:hypothetical protein
MIDMVSNMPPHYQTNKKASSTRMVERQARNSMRIYMVTTTGGMAMTAGNEGKKCQEKEFYPALIKDNTECVPSPSFAARITSRQTGSIPQLFDFLVIGIILPTEMESDLKNLHLLWTSIMAVRIRMPAMKVW